MFNFFNGCMDQFRQNKFCCLLKGCKISMHRHLWDKILVYCRHRSVQELLDYW